MAASKRQRPAPAPVSPEPGGWPVWQIALLLLASLFAVFELYGPALHGPFVLDDGYQFFGRPDVDRLQLRHWLNNVRPLLNLSFYVNYQFSGTNPFSYHAVNVLLHWLNSVLVFFILRRLVRASNPVQEAPSGWAADLAPLAAAALFLLHPVQTESVAYVSSRSELLSVLPAYAALLLFLSRPAPAISWGRAAAVVALFGCAVLTKEHTAVLPAVLLLADLCFHPSGPVRGVKANWRLYAPLAAAAVTGLVFIWKTLSKTKSAGFQLAGLSWHEYFFTQWRMFWRYLRLALFPAGLNADPDIALSRTPFEHGAIFYGLALLALLAAAFLYRRRFPLAAFGIFAFALLLAPTSSFVPIRDLFAERRLYLPMIGLLCVAVEFLRRLDLRSTPVLAALAALLAASSYLAWQRAHVWSGAIPLWQDTVAKSPNKYRPRFQLAYALYHADRCPEAAAQYEQAAALEAEPAENLLVDWSLALECAGRPADAAAKLEQAARLHPTAVVYTNLAMLHGKAGRHEQALEALSLAERQDPSFAQIYAFRGNIYFAMNRPAEAAVQYRRALQIDPANQAAQHGLRALAGQ